VVSSVKVKGKKVKSLCLTKHHAMKTYCGSGGIAPRIPDLGTRWRWVVRFTPRRFTPRERAPGTHWTGGWVCPRAHLDAVQTQLQRIHISTTYFNIHFSIINAWMPSSRMWSLPLRYLGKNVYVWFISTCVLHVQPLASFLVKQHRNNITSRALIMKLFTECMTQR